MKKCLSLIVALLLLLCSCSGNEPEVHKTPDMLSITNTDKTLPGCLDRMNDVLVAVKSKISILEAEHNRAIKIENPAEYFLDTDYIHTAFDPFLLSSQEIINSFNAEMNEETAKTFYSQFTGGSDIFYESDGETIFTLRFVSEESTRVYSAEYNKKTDSFRYTVRSETTQEEKLEEFLEFSKIKNGGYVIQSLHERFFAEFDEEGNIVEFCSGTLRNGTFPEEESIFPSPAKTTDEHWVLSRGKSQFSDIHTFKDGILTHEDCSSGPWKSIRIDAKNYESAFYDF